MNFENCFPLWNDLNTTQKKIISDNLITQYVKKGTIIHNGNLELVCKGVLVQPRCGGQVVRPAFPVSGQAVGRALGKGEIFFGFAWHFSLLL